MKIRGGRLTSGQTRQLEAQNNSLESLSEGSISRQCSLYFQHAALRTKKLSQSLPLRTCKPVTSCLSSRPEEPAMLEFEDADTVIAINIKAHW